MAVFLRAPVSTSPSKLVRRVRAASARGFMAGRKIQGQRLAGWISRKATVASSAAPSRAQ
ncbi:hypothetical protein D3C79_1077670 [compost metagenome]